jgi:hypothetical protein
LAIIIFHLIFIASGTLVRVKLSLVTLHKPRVSKTGLHYGLFLPGTTVVSFIGRGAKAPAGAAS